MALEPRMMFDAAGFASGTEIADHDHPIEQFPRLSAETTTIFFKTNGNSVPLPRVTLDASEDAMICGIQLTFDKNNFSPADKLDFSDTNEIKGIWQKEGILSLVSRSGDPLPATHLQTALNNVTYVYRHTGPETSLTLGERTIRVAVVDDTHLETQLLFTLKQEAPSAPTRTGQNFAPSLERFGTTCLDDNPLTRNDAALYQEQNYITDIKDKDVARRSALTSVGLLVANILNGMVDDPNISDDDNPQSRLGNQGMAVVGVDNANGLWQYSIDDGTKWSTMEGVQSDSALLLTGTLEDRIRFVPNTLYAGSTSISFRAWDLHDTDGKMAAADSLTFVNTFHNGGTTPYSTEVVTMYYEIVPGAAVAFKNYLVSVSSNETTSPQQSTFTAAVSPIPVPTVAPTKPSPGNDHSHGSSQSDDGRYLVFASDATNLVPGDTNGCRDVFLRDTLTGRIQRLSDGTEGEANGNSDDPVISGDGRTVVFVSSATNLVTGDNNFRSDIFRFTVAENKLTRVSVDSFGTEADDASFSPDISRTGDKIVFVSRATRLVRGDDNDTADIFLKDGTTGEVRRLTNGVNGGQANESSFDPAISGDGQWVVFSSNATNLIGDDTNGFTDIFKVATTGSATIVRLQGSAAPNGPSSHPDISADGSRVVFTSHASNLVPSDTNKKGDIFLYGSIKDNPGPLATLSLDKYGNDAGGDSFFPSLSTDGRFVTFLSQASTLDNPGITSFDTNDFPDIFLRSIDTGQTVRLSLHESGMEANGPVFSTPSINGDGRFVSYVSTAGNLVDGHSPATKVQHLFLAEINSSPRLNADLYDNLHIVAEPDVAKGVTIAQLSGRAIKDYNPEDSQGVAIVGISGKGTWQFSTNDGANWSNLSQISQDSATLLKDDGRTRIRFVSETIPTTGGVGMTFRAWDGTMGHNGQAGIAMNFVGGATAFSENAVTTQWYVKTGKTEPALDVNSPYLVRYVQEDNDGVLLTALLGSRFSGSGPGQGMALTAVDDRQGDWAYSSRGDFSDAVALTNLSPTSMTLLEADGSTRIRFVPKTTGYTGSASLSFRAWDGVLGNHGDQGVHPDTLNLYNTLGKQTATATFTVNKDPVGVSDQFRVYSGQSLSLPILANDRDEDGDSLSVRNLMQPALGFVSYDKIQNSVTYSAPNHPDKTEWRYYLSDGLSTVPDPITVFIEILPLPVYQRGKPVLPSGEKTTVETKFDDIFLSGKKTDLASNLTDEPTDLLPSAIIRENSPPITITQIMDQWTFWETEKLGWIHNLDSRWESLPSDRGRSQATQVDPRDGSVTREPAPTIPPGKNEANPIPEVNEKSVPRSSSRDDAPPPDPDISGRQGFSKQVAGMVAQQTQREGATSRLMRWISETGEEL